METEKESVKIECNLSDIWPCLWGAIIYLKKRFHDQISISVIIGFNKNFQNAACVNLILIW